MLFNVGEFTVSNYVTVSINNWLAFVSCIQMIWTQLMKAYMAEMSYNELLIDTATYVSDHSLFCMCPKLCIGPKLAL